MFFNTGLDQHGQKIYLKSIELGYKSPQDFCDELTLKWKEFYKVFQIDYDNFYLTTSFTHKKNVIRFFEEIKYLLYTKEYHGKYCVGCESIKTEKEISDGKCLIHNTELVDIAEENTFFPLKKFAKQIEDILVNKSLSLELSNLLKEDYDLSITRKNVKWAVELNEDETIYVWFEALLNYIFAIKFYEDRNYFNSFWENSLIICGKDNLKFQAYILQAMLLSNEIHQNEQILVHGTILDEKGSKMSKSLGNVIDPIEQKEKYGVSPLKYYLVFGLSTYDDSKYSESDLVSLWNTDIVNGIGNLISRTLHLIDIKGIIPDVTKLSKESIDNNETIVLSIDKAFTEYKFDEVRNILNSNISVINKRFQDEKPYGKDCVDYERILTEIYYHTKILVNYYRIILKEYSKDFDDAFINNKKIILFKPL